MSSASRADAGTVLTWSPACRGLVAAAGGGTLGLTSHATDPWLLGSTADPLVTLAGFCCSAVRLRTPYGPRGRALLLQAAAVGAQDAESVDGEKTAPVQFGGG
jgi:hypothetical protein